MEIAKIRVFGTFAKVIKRTDVPAGLVGGTIRVEFADPLWENLDKLVVFKGVVTKDVITDGGVVDIPREVIAMPNKRFQVGFCGTDAASEVMIPTFYADLGIIRPATDPSEDTSTDPTLPVWAQVQTKVNKVEEDVEYLRKKGHPEKGEDYWTEEDQAEIIEEIISLLPTDLTGYAKEKWVQENFQPKGDYLLSSQLPDAVNDALAQAKASGEFDGKDGKDGSDGKDGADGKDGINGKDGIDGKTPVKGEDYWTAADKTEIVNQVISALPVYNGEVE